MILYRAKQLARLGGYGALILTALLGLLLAGEVALKLLSDWEKIKITSPPGYTVYDAEAGYDIAPLTHGGVFRFKGGRSEIFSNELGCYDAPYKQKRGEKAILLVGDSFTWGYAPFSAIYGSVVEKALETRVLKCGVPGYGTRQEYFKAKKVLARIPAPPSLLMVGYLTGDDLEGDYLLPNRTILDGVLVEKAFLKDLETGAREEFSDDKLKEQIRKFRLLQKFGLRYSPNLLQLLKNNSILYNTVVKSSFFQPISCRIRAPSISFTAAEKQPWLKLAWDEHLESFKKLKQLASGRGLKLFVVLIPSKYQVYDFLRASCPGMDPEYPNKKLAVFFEKEGIEYLDLLPEFKKYADQRPRLFLDYQKDLYWRFDGHWNSNGHRLAGLLIARELIKRGYYGEDKFSRIESELAQLKIRYSVPVILR